MNNKSKTVNWNSVCEEIRDIDEYVNIFYNKPTNKHEWDIDIVNSLVGNNIKEKILNSVFVLDEKSNDLETVLLKVTLLNSFYSTGIKNIHLVAVANHIREMNVYSRLKEVKKSGKIDLELVNDIAYGKSKFKTEDMSNIYSFATKYCSWHQPDKYPIADSYTKGMLYYINKETSFYCEKLTQKDLNDYKKYYEVYLSFIENLKKFGVIGEKSYKEIDIFLWLYGKINDIKFEETGLPNQK